MIQIENTEISGWEAAIRGMRNPMNSWDRSDSCFCPDEPRCEGNCPVFIGKNDIDLMKRLADGGSVHAKYRRMITVSCDMVAPLYWWKEFDTYKVGTVANSCSTMHKIAAKPFEIDDFSHEHLALEKNAGMGALIDIIDALNLNRKLYLQSGSKDKTFWWQMIQLLPSSYNQRRTVMLNYEVLQNIYVWRKDHKLDEWHIFCDWIRTLPYSELITGVAKDCERSEQNER